MRKKPMKCARVTEHERLAIESFYEELSLGDFEKAAEVYEEWQRLYPEDINVVRESKKGRCACTA